MKKEKIDNIINLVHSISINYNIDKKNIIKDFLNYIIKNYPKYVNSKFLNFVENIQKETDKTNAELLLLAGAILKSDIAKRKLLQKRLETLIKQFARVRNEAKTETVKQFKAELQNNIPNRSESNAEYGVGRASSEIREAEYQAIKDRKSVV